LAEAVEALAIEEPENFSNCVGDIFAAAMANNEQLMRDPDALALLAQSMYITTRISISIA